MAQPWKFHSLAEVVSRRIQGLDGAGDVALAVAPGSDLPSARLGLGSTGAFVGLTSAFPAETVGVAVFRSSSVSPLRKNSASLPSMELLKMRKDLPSGPTATNNGTPCTRSTIG